MNILTDEEKLSKEAINLLLPKVKNAIKDVVEDKVGGKIPDLKASIASELWDKAVAEIGKTMKLPPEIIAKLQTIDDLVTTNKASVEGKIEEMIKRVSEFENRLKGVDLNETVTMSYRQLQDEKRQSAKSWGVICWIAGFLAGLVTFISFNPLN